MGKRVLRVLDIGRRGYDEVWALQKELHAAAAAGPGLPACLILVEHSPVITLGRRADKSNVLLGAAELAERGVEVRQVDRGGDVTYHGPGQLVAYPIMRLAGERRDVHGYFRALEQVVIDLLAEYGIAAGRHEGLTGVWAGDEKICAMGVAIRRWTTYHGIALNVSTNLEDFRLITPCGLADKGVTSMERLLGRGVPMKDVAEKLVRHFAAEFEFSEVTQ
ncbi:MAG: lipoyl(octanoyl) transferase LipB [Planctomycetota bacterium]